MVNTMSSSSTEFSALGLYLRRDQIECIRNLAREENVPPWILIQRMLDLYNSTHYSDRDRVTFEVIRASKIRGLGLDPDRIPEVLEAMTSPRDKRVFCMRLGISSPEFASFSKIGEAEHVSRQFAHVLFTRALNNARMYLLTRGGAHGTTDGD